jgi:hypothetical protein
VREEKEAKVIEAGKGENEHNQGTVAAEVLDSFERAAGRGTRSQE